MFATEALVAITAFLVSYIFLRRLSDPLRKIPGPAGVPVFGQLFQIHIESFHLKLTEWSKRYGSVMRISLPGQDIVVLSGIDVVHEALVTRGTDFAGRPPLYRACRITYGKDIGFQNFSSDTVALKKMAQKALKPYGKGMVRLEEIMAEAVTEFIDDIGRKKGEAFEIKTETTLFVCNVLATLLYGEKFCPSDPTLSALLEMNDTMLACIDPTSPGSELDLLPWLRYTGLCREGLATVAKAEKLRSDVIEKKITQARESLNPSTPRGCLDLFLLCQLEERDTLDQPIWDDEHLSALCLDIITAGMKTTISVMSAVYMLLVKHLDIQAKVQEEIDRVVGRAHMPTLQDCVEMPYTEAFVLETLRYTSILPISLPRMTMTDTHVGGFSIPANTQIYVNQWAIHHNEDVYQHPFKFDPSRFLDCNGVLVPHDHPVRSSLIAFGLGRRVCLGEHLARTRLFLLISALLQRFHLVEDTTQSIPDSDPRTFKMGMVMQPPSCRLMALARY